MEDDQNGRRPKWKTTEMEDDQNGRRPKWKRTKMEDNQNGRRPKWKTTKIEDDQNGRVVGRDSIFWPDLGQILAHRQCLCLIKCPKSSLTTSRKSPEAKILIK